MVGYYQKYISKSIKYCRIIKNLKQQKQQIKDQIKGAFVRRDVILHFNITLL